MAEIKAGKIGDVKVIIVLADEPTPAQKAQLEEEAVEGLLLTASDILVDGPDPYRGDLLRRLFGMVKGGTDVGHALREGEHRPPTHLEVVQYVRWADMVIVLQTSLLEETLAWHAWLKPYMHEARRAGTSLVVVEQ